MKNEQLQIRAFMTKAGQAIPEYPVMPDEKIRLLRYWLIYEELQELAHAFGFEALSAADIEARRTPQDPVRPANLVEAYDAILDLLVVVIGTAVALGLDIDPGWEEVHRSNMSKFIDGHKREDGKWIKGPSYSPANLAPIVSKLQTELYAKGTIRALDYDYKGLLAWISNRCGTPSVTEIDQTGELKVSTKYDSSEVCIKLRPDGTWTFTVGI